MTYAETIGAVKEEDKPWRKWTKCPKCGWIMMCNIFGYQTDNPVARCFWCEEEMTANKLGIS